MTLTSPHSSTVSTEPIREDDSPIHFWGHLLSAFVLPLLAAKDVASSAPMCCSASKLLAAVEWKVAQNALFNASLSLSRSVA